VATAVDSVLSVLRRTLGTSIYLELLAEESEMRDHCVLVQFALFCKFASSRSSAARHMKQRSPGGWVAWMICLVLVTLRTTTRPPDQNRAAKPETTAVHEVSGFGLNRNENSMRVPKGTIMAIGGQWFRWLPECAGLHLHWTGGKLQTSTTKQTVRTSSCTTQWNEPRKAGEPRPNQLVPEPLLLSESSASGLARRDEVTDREDGSTF
jgi:hypothetical protein